MPCLAKRRTVTCLIKLAVFRTNLTEGQLATSRISGADAAFSRQQIEDDLR
jgi:hypothetical protein